jgi:hypothetical protein
MTRPVGKKPLGELSDWTEQDLLTIDEARGRLAEEMAEARAALAVATSADEKEALERRIRAMEASLQRLEE